MKRADQHTVPAHTQFGENYAPKINNPDESGVDTPSEKEIPIPESDQPPSMGALPVDVMGCPKTEDEQESIEGDESTGGNKIIATGTGPDPEHMPDN